MVTLIRVLKMFIRIIVLLLLTFFASPAYAVCNSNLPVEQREPDCPAGLDQFEQMVGSIISVFAGLGFIAMLVLLVWAGFKYLTSGGEPKAIQAAHAVTTWALLGVLFMAIAWLILQLIQSFTGINVTVFDIKSLCDVAGQNFCKSGP